VRTPAWTVVEGWALRDLGAGAALGRVAERVGMPCVVKPSRSGSALGMSFIEREADLATAVMAALSFAGAAIVEAKVEGSEVAAGFVGEPPEALPLVEIVPKGGLYDYAARYTAGATEYFAPARLDDATSHAVTEVALAALTALHLRDVTRVDTIVDRDGIPWVLEVNVAPGMTDTSLLPMAAQVAGWSMADLCDRVVQAAARRST
jgi:D-alanine-D-alanine ligase